MYQKNKKNILNDKDRNLLEYLFMNKVALPKQINRDVFGKLSMPNVYRRLYRLTNAQFILHHYFTWNGDPYRAFSLTPQGFKTCVKGDDVSHIRKQLRSENVIHDIQLVDIQERFNRLTMVLEYHTENYLRSNCDHARIVLKEYLNNINSDALLKIKFSQSEHYVPLEYEREQKVAKRYENLFLDYYLNSKVPAVLYIAENEKVLKKMVEVATNVSSGFPPKIFFIPYDKLMANDQSVTFINHLGHQMQLK
ncbi:MAG: hypothetical protein HQK49_17065 [Oligoflexia bacterium]|nr:hypothetical protein [Oligoflexia bacterium]